MLAPFNQEGHMMHEADVELCAWSPNDNDGCYDTSCGEKFIFMHDGPEQNDFRFCPFCGKNITVPPNE